MHSSQGDILDGAAPLSTMMGGLVAQRSRKTNPTELGYKTLGRFTVR